MPLRLSRVGSKSITLSGARKGRSPCAYNMNAAPMLCVTVGERTPSNPSQTNPSVNWWTANSVGSDAKINSRLCFTFVNVTTPTVPRTPLPTKFAVAEKHMARPLPCEDYTAFLRAQYISLKLCVHQHQHSIPMLPA